MKQFDLRNVDDDNGSKHTRREFCEHACRAVSLLGFAALLPGCGGASSPAAPSGTVAALPVVSAPVTNGAATLTIDSSSPLAAVGGAALVQASGTNLLVARTAADAFVAFTAICTHQACTISGYANQLFICPCHGSEFNMSGTPVSGPARANLRQYTTAFANNVLTISA